MRLVRSRQPLCSFALFTGRLTSLPRSLNLCPYFSPAADGGATAAAVLCCGIAALFLQGAALNELGRDLKAQVIEIKALGAEIKALGGDITAQVIEIKALGAEIRAQGAEIKAQGAEIKALGAEIKALGAEIKAQGVEIKALGAEIKSLGAEIKAQVIEIKAQGAEIKAQSAEIKAQGEMTHLLLQQILDRLPPHSRSQSSAGSPPQGLPSAPSSVTNSSSVRDVSARDVP